MEFLSVFMLTLDKSTPLVGSHIVLNFQFALYNFSNFVILAINTMVGYASMWSPLIANKTYYVGIKGCKP